MRSPVLAMVLAGTLPVVSGADPGLPLDPDLILGDMPVAVSERRTEDRALEVDEIRFQTRLQLQYEFRDPDQGPADDDLVLRRAKLIGSWRMGPRWATQAQLEAREGSPYFEDFYLTYELRRWSRLWLGQFKSALSRIQLTSSGQLLFADRPMAARVFSARAFEVSPVTSYEAIQGHGGDRILGARITRYWYFGNGGREGDELGIRLRADVGRGVRTDRFEGGLSHTIRLEIHPDGNPGYQEGNPWADRQGRLSFDFSLRVDRDHRELDLDGDGRISDLDGMDRRISDVGWTYRRDRFSTQAEFFRQVQAPVSGIRPEQHSSGHYVQLGWVWKPRRWESGFRSGEVDPDRSLGSDLRTERAASLVRYLGSGKSKAVLEAVRRTDQASPRRDETTWRLQYLFVF